MDSIPFFSFPVRTICKNHRINPVYIMVKPPNKKAEEKKIRRPLLSVHGNIFYDLTYRSQVDTPYQDRSVYQHTAQVYLDISYKDNYPFRLFFTTRWSNSSWFRNFSDVNFLYNANEFNNRVRRQVQQLLLQNLYADSLSRLRNLLAAREHEYLTLKDRLNGASYLQLLMRAREYKWLMAHRDTGAHAPPVDTAGIGQVLNGYGKYKFGGHRTGPATGNREDSLTKSLNDTSAYIERYDSAQKKLDSLQATVGRLEKSYQDLQQLQSGAIAKQQQDLDQTGNGTALKEKLTNLHISDSSLPKGYQTLLSVKSFGIGRAMLDYSELSAKNININGVQVEYNPSYYAAFAAGTVDYRFRDYTMQSPLRGQYVVVGRYGLGPKEGSHVILTYYTGRRQLYNSYATGSLPTGPISPQTPVTPIPNYSLMGFTIEGHYKISRTSSLIAEIAKSSSPYFSQDSSHSNTMGSALKLNDHSNEAYSLKYNVFIPVTQTQIMAGYLHYGGNFQSFSIFTSGTEQSAWSAKVSQPFFHQHLNVTASVRTNDLSNPLVNAAYSSNTVFKSLQATLRLPKWPTLSLGYFPSSQILKVNDNQFTENLFYTLTASASEAFKIHKATLVSTLLYTQFYNKVTDTNFVYFNTRNWIYSQYAFIGRWTWELQLSAAMNTSYELYVIENKAGFTVNHWLSLGAGIKYNKQTVYDIIQWGYSGDAVLRVPKLGELRLLADKGFIPGNNKQLVPDNTGRITYIKTF